MVTTKFKQTEIGLIPEDWELSTLPKLVLNKVGIKIGPFGSQLRKEFLVKCGYKVYGQENIYANDFSLGDRYLEKNHFEKLSTCSIVVDDFLISMMGTIGKCAIVPKNVEQGIIDSHLIRIRFDKKLVFNKYMLQLFQSFTIFNQIQKLSVGGIMDGLSSAIVKSFIIPLPTLPEQVRIAKVLSDTDAWIENLEKLIDKKRLIKQGAMQELLTPKEDWKEVILGDLTKVFTKQTGFDYSAYIKPSLVKFKNKDVIPFIQNKDFHNKNINLNTDYYIPLNVALGFPNILLDEKSLLISISGSIGNVGVYELSELAFIGGAVAILKFRNPRLIDWIMYYLKSTEGQNKLFGNVKSGSHQNLILDDIRKVEIPFPSISEQIRITTILSDMDAEIEALEKKLHKAKQLKQGMMQELLTGRIRLVEPTEINKPTKGHNDQFNDAVLIATMASVFGSDKFPLTRFKYTKVSYLLKRYKEEQDAGYLKHAAGPYKPKTRYGGAEKIAINKKYIDVVVTNYKGKEYEGFVASENVGEAIKYFEDWYGTDALKWIEQFKFEKNDNLELWATVDMAIEDLKKKDEIITVGTIKQVLKENKEWKDKLKRSIFSDINIQKAIIKLETLFT